MRFGPGADGLVVAAFVLRVEVDEGFERRVGGLEPDLAKDARVDGAHELLADDVEAMCWGFGK